MNNSSSSRSRIIAISAIWAFCGALVYAVVQDPPPDQPHTEDPAQCTRYCYPRGGEKYGPPKGVPKGIPGYECHGDKCAKIAQEPGEGEEDNCSEGTGCTSFCAKVCCTCLAACL